MGYGLVLNDITLLLHKFLERKDACVCFYSEIWNLDFWVLAHCFWKNNIVCGAEEIFYEILLVRVNNRIEECCIHIKICMIFKHLVDLLLWGTMILIFGCISTHPNPYLEIFKKRCSKNSSNSICIIKLEALSITSLEIIKIFVCWLMLLNMLTSAWLYLKLLLLLKRFSLTVNSFSIMNFHLKELRTFVEVQIQRNVLRLDINSKIKIIFSSCKLSYGWHLCSIELKRWSYSIFIEYTLNHGPKCYHDRYNKNNGNDSSCYSFVFRFFIIS